MSVSSDGVFVIVLGKTRSRYLFSSDNIKIFAVRSLADICFLHVLYLVFLMCYTIRCFSYEVRFELRVVYIAAC